jgi:hypothetical protein
MAKVSASTMATRSTPEDVEVPTNGAGAEAPPTPKAAPRKPRKTRARATAAPSPAPAQQAPAPRSEPDEDELMRLGYLTYLALQERVSVEELADRLRRVLDAYDRVTGP